MLAQSTTGDITVEEFKDKLKNVLIPTEEIFGRYSAYDLINEKTGELVWETEIADFKRRESVSAGGRAVRIASVGRPMSSLIISDSIAGNQSAIDPDSRDRSPCQVTTPLT